MNTQTTNNITHTQETKPGTLSLKYEKATAQHINNRTQDNQTAPGNKIQQPTDNNRTTNTPTSNMGGT